MTNNLWRDHGRVDWSQASCMGMATEEFYPDDRGNPYNRNPVLRKVCQGCPILLECANYSVFNEQHGFWGGLSGRARRDIRREYNIDEPTYKSPINDANILAARAAKARELLEAEEEYATTG
jgi:hypothetical protein